MAAATTMQLLGSRSVGGVVDLGDLATLIDRLRPQSARIEPVLVVVATEDAPTVRHTLSMARAAAPGAHCVVHETSLPPLARGHLVDTLASLSPRLTSGELLVACDLIERQVVSGALVRSVTRLRTPAPTMGQHVRSWLPSSRFVVQTHPTARVTAVHPGEIGACGLPQMQPGSQIMCSPVDPGDETTMLAIAQQLTGGSLHEVPAPKASTRWWKAPFTEFAAFPTDLMPQLESALADARPCRSCGAAVVWSSCRVCRAQQQDSATCTPFTTGAA